jgi:hypothetical protein
MRPRRVITVHAAIAAHLARNGAFVATKFAGDGRLKTALGVPLGYHFSFLKRKMTRPSLGLRSKGKMFYDHLAIEPPSDAFN